MQRFRDSLLTAPPRLLSLVVRPGRASGVAQAAVNVAHIRVADLDRAERFYTAIGVRFRRATYCTPNVLVSEGEAVQFEVHVRGEREGTEGLVHRHPCFVG